jgi:amino acid adenylation domain-containing protein
MQDKKYAIAARFAGLPKESRTKFLAALSEKGIDFGKLPIIKDNNNDKLALSSSQTRQWFLWQLAPEGTAYHISGALNLVGALDVDAFKASFDGLVARHETLRTIFSSDGDGSAHQVIQEELLLDIPVIDLSVLSGEEQAKVVKSQALAWHATSFDLTKGPLLRVGLIQLAVDKHVLVVVMHHIISDGWSMQVLVNEFVSRYQAAVEGIEIILPELPIQYADYAVWQRNWLEAGELEKQLSYWREHLGDELPVLQLPTDTARHLEANYTQANHGFTLPAELSQGLKKVTKEYQSTLFMTLLSAYQTLLYRYTGQEDIRIGVPIANRHRSEVENVIGFFVNTQVLRGVVHGRMSLSEMLQQVKVTALGAQENQDLPFEKLVEALQPERSLSHTPLFQVMYNHQRDDSALTQMSGLSIDDYELGEKGAQFELTLDTSENSQGEILINFSYAKELFNTETIVRLAEYYVAILTAFTENSEQAIGDISLLDDAETKQLTAWGVNDTRYDNTQPAHQLIEQQVEFTPNATALVFKEEQLTYTELNQRANQLAHYLISQGVKPEEKVGISVERSVDMVVSLLAVLKAGGAYVPLDPDYPNERLAYIMQDSGIKTLLSQSELLKNLPELSSGSTLCLEQLTLCDEAITNPDIHLHGDNLAYLIYTSGSTGRPKGVMVCHGALSNFLNSMQEEPGMRSDDTLVAVTSLSFDIAALELYLPLLSGAKLVLSTRAGVLEGAALGELIDTSQATVFQSTPSGWRLLLASGWQPKNYELKGIKFKGLCGGEALPQDLAQELRSHGVDLWNMYGPTETTIWSSVKQLESNSPTLGKPIADTKLHIFDNQLNPVPQGVAGELYIGGAGLARGYSGRVDLTIDAFIANPFSEQGEQLYRTGDLVRWNNSGELEYLGRIDHQVKIRGFRIELGEIESELLKQINVSEAVVVAKASQSGTRLVAYVSASADTALDTNELKAVLGKSLPDYMVPSVIVLLDALPLNPNGKIDRKALPEPEFVSNNAYQAPEGTVETQLAQIWCEVLGIEQVGRHDNFFEMGGHSLLAVSLINKANKAFSISLSVRVIFEDSIFVNFSHQVSSLMETSITNDKFEGLDSLMASLENL